MTARGLWVSSSFVPSAVLNKILLSLTNRLIVRPILGLLGNN